MEKYKDWELFEIMPKGWKIDKTAGSPLFGYDFITNGKSVINGQKRALLKATKKQSLEKNKDFKIEEKVDTVINEVVIDENYLKTVNALARKKFEQKILLDIKVDLIICEIEGWDKLEYIKELQNLINGLK